MLDVPSLILRIYMVEAEKQLFQFVLGHPHESCKIDIHTYTKVNNALEKKKNSWLLLLFPFIDSYETQMPWWVD